MILPPPSLKQLDTYGGVIHIGTFSKTLFPEGLRTGWVQPPRRSSTAWPRKNNMSICIATICPTSILHSCLEEDTLAPHLVKVRREYKKRRKMSWRRPSDIAAPPWILTLPKADCIFGDARNPAISPTELLRAVRRRLNLVPGDAFYAHGAASHEIRLCFATHDEDRLSEGIRRLGRALAATGAAASTSFRRPPAAGRPII